MNEAKTLEGQGPGPCNPVGEDKFPCWRFAAAVSMRLTGLRGEGALPLEYAEALRARVALVDVVPEGEACRAGDLIEMVQAADAYEVVVRSPMSHRFLAPRERPHVGVAIDAFRLQHRGADGHAVEMRIRNARAAGLIRRVLRPRGGRR